MKYLPLLFLLVFTVAAITLRLLPHPANFAAIAALALFTGTYCVKFSKWWLLAPLAAMVVSDIFIGTYDFRIMAAVYGSFLVVGLIGIVVAKHKRVGSILLSSVTASILFYLTTNFAVWMFGTLYPLTFEGLMASYVMALPFFRNTFLGDLFYVSVFFGVYEFAVAVLPSLKSMKVRTI